MKSDNESVTTLYRLLERTSGIDIAAIATMLHSIVFVVVILCAEESLALSPYLDVYPNVTEAVQRDETSPLYFGLMLSLSGDQQSTGALAGVQAALDDINNRDDLLPGYSLHYTLTDSKVSLYMCGHVGNPAMNCNATVQQNDCSGRTVHTAV